MSTYTLHTDPDGRPTIWTKAGTRYVADRDGDLIRVNPIHADEIWAVLTRVLAPDEATIERLAEAMHDRLRWASMHWSTQHIDREAAPHLVTAMLAALGGTSAQARHTADDATGGGA